MKSGLMSVISAALGATALAAETVSKPDFDKGVEAAELHGRSEGTKEGQAAGHGEGLKAGVTGERARISAIMRGEFAKGREMTAMSLALDTDMTAEQSAAVLKNTPEHKASMLDGLVPQPKVDAEGGKESSTAKLGAAVQAKIAKMTGVKVAA